MHDSDTIQMACPKCKTAMRVSRQHAGKRLRCPNKACAAVLVVPAVSRSPQARSPESALSSGEKLCAAAIALRKQWQEKENIAKAQALFQQAIQAAPGLWKGHYGLGEILLWQVNEARVAKGPELRQGLEAVWRAAELAQDQVEPPQYLARQLASSDLDTAIRFYEYALHVAERQAEGMYPPDTQAGNHWQVGIFAGAAGHSDLASDAFRRALALNPSFASYVVDPPSANACLQEAKAIRQLTRLVVGGDSDAAPLTLPVLFVGLKVRYPGAFWLWDMQVRMFLDGEPIGTGSFKQGFNWDTRTTVGAHVLEFDYGIVNNKVKFDLPAAAGTYVAKVKYSRMNGMFQAQVTRDDAA